MLNRIIIMGRFVRDPELRHSQNGTPVTSYTLAVDRDFKSGDSGKRETDFIDCTAWRGTAEMICKYFSKGRLSVVEGRLQIREWKDRDGNNRRTAEVVTENIYFADSKKKDDSQGGEAAPDYGEPPPESGGFHEIDDEDGTLPF